MSAVGFNPDPLSVTSPSSPAKLIAVEKGNSSICSKNTTFANNDLKQNPVWDQKKDRTEISITPQLEQFNNDANKPHGIVITSCLFEPSGCHTLGTDLKENYPNLNHVIYLQNDGFKTRKILDSDKCEIIIFTGCVSSQVLNILNTAITQFDLKKLKRIYALIPPHLTTKTLNHPANFRILLRALLKDYELITLRASFDISDNITLGYPMPSLEASSYEIDCDCLGIIYVRHFKNNSSWNLSLNDYFKFIASISKTSDPYVLVVAFDSPQFYEIAEQYNVDIEFVSRLPKKDFIKAIKMVGENGGVLFTDGTTTHIQSLFLQTPAFYYAITNTFPYQTEMLRLMGKSNNEIVRGLLRVESDETDYKVIANETSYNLMTRMSFIIREGVRKFNLVHQSSKDQKPIVTTVQVENILDQKTVSTIDITSKSNSLTSTLTVESRSNLTNSPEEPSSQVKSLTPLLKKSIFAKDAYPDLKRDLEIRLTPVKGYK